MQLRIFDNNQYSAEQLLELATAPLRYQSTVDSLLAFYDHIKSLWSRHAIKSLAFENGLNLRRTEDKLIFAQLAATIELDNLPINNLLEAELEATKTELAVAKETIIQQEMAIALLKAGKPLNGRENTPIFKVFGSPTTKDSFISNYRKLRLIEHPDVSNYPPEVACDRFSFLKAAYTALLSNWDVKYDPTLPITLEELDRAMSAKLPFPATSFNY